MTESTTINTRILLAARPTGYPEISDFEIDEAPIPAPGSGEILVRMLYLSLDPYMRHRMGDARSYAPPAALGEVMIGGTVGEVTASHHADWRVGDIVEGRLGWQQYAISDGTGLAKVDPSLAPVSTALGVLGMPGMTAYFGSSRSDVRCQARPSWFRPLPARSVRWWAKSRVSPVAGSSASSAARARSPTSPASSARR